MILHALVSDLETAERAADGGATVIQLRLKDLPTEELVEQGRPYRDLCREHGILFIVNDDLEAAHELGADGVHLGQSDVVGHSVRASEMLLGISAATVEQAVAGEQLGASYIGAGPVWTTPSKPDAGEPIGLDGLAMICDSISIPVVAIGGVDESNVGDCLAAGATGVAVIRAATRMAAMRDAIDRAAG